MTNIHNDPEFIATEVSQQGESLILVMAELRRVIEQNEARVFDGKRPDLFSKKLLDDLHSNLTWYRQDCQKARRTL